MPDQPESGPPSTLIPVPPLGTDGNRYLPVGGGYQLMRLLGRGNFGEVWHALAPGGVEVAVKLITRSLQDQATQRELAILEKIKRLRHQNLLSLQAFFPLRDRLVIVVELADRSLASRLEECLRNGLPGIAAGELSAYFREAGEALDYLHANKLQHRDIKPDNLLLLGRHVKVADFGLARLLEKQVLETASHAGTPLYTAPEVWNGKLSVHSDQYSLAVTYAHLRLGRPPFQYQNLAQLMAAHLLGKPDLEPLAEAEQRVLLQALARKPSERYGSCVEFAEALAEAVPAAPRPLSGRLVNTIGMELVLIPAGRFLMGSPPNEKDRRSDEQQHEVEITRPFYLGVYQVTQEEYERIMGRNPSYFSATGGGKDQVKGLDTRRFPVENVSWDDAVAFCRKLSELPAEKAAGRAYRLPTEAEWEYACRGGAPFQHPFHFGPSLSPEQANFDGNFPYGDAPKGPYLQRTTTVGSYPANAFGLHDMHGNVWEWCADWYDADYYQNSPGQDPLGPPLASGRVLRGGGWYDHGRICRSAYRLRYGPDNRNYFYGFRLAAVSCSVGAE
jgi:formylglycine-generating enzyme required for sulfatase activity